MKIRRIRYIGTIKELEQKGNQKEFEELMGVAYNKTYCDFNTCIKFKECSQALPEKLKNEKVSKFIMRPSCYNKIKKSAKIEKYNWNVNDKDF